MKMGIELKNELMSEAMDSRILCIAINNSHEILFSSLSNGNVSIWSLNE